MDELGFHPYPNQNNDPPLKGYPWPKAGIPKVSAYRQAVYGETEPRPNDG